MTNSLGMTILIGGGELMWREPVFWASTRVGNQAISQNVYTYNVYHKSRNILFKKESPLHIADVDDSVGIVLLIKE